MNFKYIYFITLYSIKICSAFIFPLNNYYNRNQLTAFASQNSIQTKTKILFPSSFQASHVNRIRGLFLEDHIFRLSLLLAPKMVTQAIMEGGLSNTANAAGDSEQSELLALSVEECLRSPDSAANILPNVDDASVNGNLLVGTVNETYEGSIKSVDLSEDKDHSDIILTIEGGSGKKDDLPETESLQAMVFQVFIPFMIAGCGTVAAGIVLDIVQVGCRQCCQNRDFCF